MKHISDEVYRINSAEAILGDIMLINDKLIVQFSNINIINEGKDIFFKGHSDGLIYLNFCFAIFEGVETITFDYDQSRLIDPEKRQCYGGEHYLTGVYSEFWISYKKGKIFLIEESEFIKAPQYLTNQERIDILIKNPITKDILNELGVL